MQIDFLVIGQGISGTFLSYYLLKEGKRVLVIDDYDPSSSSRLAGGIINPVTGRRMSTVWMADQVIPYAWQAYNEMSADLGINTIERTQIIDFFPNPFMREGFLKRIEEGNQYTSACENGTMFKQHFQFDFGCGRVSPVYIAQLETLLPVWRKKLQEQNALLEEEFDIAQLNHFDDHITYKDVHAVKLIFCEGPSGISNPFFKKLPFAPNKGEALIVAIENLPPGNIYKKSLMLVPTPRSNQYWVGSSYVWDFDNPGPTPEFRQATEKALQEWIKHPVKTIEHRAGLRPATLERRPFVGLHPHAHSIGILNGMGTKGCSLAPFFAKQLSDFLVRGEMITPEADVKRFTRILS